MSEFFKAAVRCDRRVAKQAPMYVDEMAVLEEQFKHEKLVDECVKSKLVLTDVNRTLALEPNASGMPVVAKYAPSSRDLNAAPETRRVGTSHLKRRVHDAIFEKSREFEVMHDSIRQAEEKERSERLKRLKHAREEQLSESKAMLASAADGPKVLSPPKQPHAAAAAAGVTSSQANGMVSSLDSSLAPPKRRHPIDVVQDQVQASILQEIAAYDHSQRTAMVLRQESLEDAVSRTSAVNTVTKLPQFRLPGPMTHIPAAW
jgi:hypothetical protein